MTLDPPKIIKVQPRDNFLSISNMKQVRRNFLTLNLISKETGMVSLEIRGFLPQFI